MEPDNIDCYDNKDCWGAMTNPKVPFSFCFLFRFLFFFLNSSFLFLFEVNRGSKVEQEQIGFFSSLFPSLFFLYLFILSLPDYNLWLASIGHENGLSVAMKNTMGLVPQVSLSSLSPFSLSFNL